MSKTLDGRRKLDGDLDPEGGEIVATALRLAESPEVDGERRRTPAQRRADGLVDLCRWFLDHRSRPASARRRPHVNVIVDVSTLTDDAGIGSMRDGGLITPEHLGISLNAPAALPVRPAQTGVVAAASAAASTARPSSAGDLNAIERAMIEQALQSARFNKSKAAQALGMTRHQLYIRMKKHGFE